MGVGVFQASSWISRKRLWVSLDPCSWACERETCLVSVDIMFNSIYFLNSVIVILVVFFVLILGTLINLLHHSSDFCCLPPV